MSTKFFTNSEENTLIKKFEGVFTYNPNIQYFDALVGYFRANACFTQEILLNDLNSMNIINIQENPMLILGILNSKLISYWFAHKFGKLQRGIFPEA
jgi:hypothetical protein